MNKQRKKNINRTQRKIIDDVITMIKKCRKLLMMVHMLLNIEKTKYGMKAIKNEYMQHPYITNILLCLTLQ